MKLQHISLENFRNHNFTLADCSPGVNFIFGDNGEGKTNFLEGISYLFLSRSFFSANDAIVVKLGEQGFTTAGTVFSDRSIEYNIRIEFNRQQGQKSVSVNKIKIDKASLMIGRFPVVILSPEHSAVTFGLPADRRRFIDFVVSQSNRIYMDNLIDYRRILKQRNKILSEMQLTKREERAAIELWNESLVRVGTLVMKKRMEFVDEFQNIMISSFIQITGSAEHPGISYLPSFECAENNKEIIEAAFYQELQNQYQNEKRIGHTLVGPHRDEFSFNINGLNMRSYASQGQHKTYLIALKLAEFFYLREKCNETPVLLFDDVLSDLDKKRSQQLLEVAVDVGQIFITSTDVHALEWPLVVSASPRKFFIKQGRIERVEDTAQIC